MAQPRYPLPASPTPTAPQVYDQSWMARFAGETQARINRCISAETANHSLLLMSPGGKVFEITVDDAGVITATHVRG